MPNTMPKKRNIISGIIILIVLAILLLGPAIRKHFAYERNMDLARQVHKVMTRLMYDLREAKHDSLQNVPPDGKWHQHPVFSIEKEGKIVYSLHEGHLIRSSRGQNVVIAQHIASLQVRRFAKERDIWEVRIEAKNKLTLTSNLKIRPRN
jgi:hypothetical protein